MPCRNTSQLINVKSFRKTPHVPFTYCVCVCLVPFLWSPLPPSLHPSIPDPQQKTDIFNGRGRQDSGERREGKGACTFAVCSYLCPHCTLHVQHIMIMMANYAISKGLCLVSVRRPSMGQMIAINSWTERIHK